MGIERNKFDAMRFGVRGVPSIRILGGDGVVRDGIDGYAPKRVVIELLSRSLGVSAAREDKTLQEAVALLDSGKVPDDKWPLAMLAAGMPGGRTLVRERLLRTALENRVALVRLLEHPRLAVRLGALDLLEEVNGETLGFDPWRDEDGDNAAALGRWKAWAGAATNETAAVFTALTRESFDGYVQDLIADRGDPDRAARARRMLIQGGRSTAGWLTEFVAAHPELPPGMRRRIQEVKYAILLPAIAGVEPALLAHRLVSGNLDMRLRAIRELPRTGKAALPVLQELIEDRDPMVREAVVESALKAGRDLAVGMVEKLAATEKDRDVLFVMVRELRRVTSAKGLAVLGSFLRHGDEDLAIAAFSTLAKMESKRSVADVRAGLRDPRWRVRVAALQCVQALKLPELVSDVEGLLDDTDEFVRFSAVQTLAEVKGKQTAKKLEAVFLRDDNLKGPVLAAFGEMDIPLPDSFRQALSGKPVSVLLGVAGGLRKCGSRGLPLAAGLAEHPDNDIACVALTVLAECGTDLPQYRGALVTALRSKDRERVLTVLRGMRRDRSESRYSASFPSDPFSFEPLPETEQGTNTPAVVNDILNAFLGDGAAAPASVAPTNQPAPKPQGAGRGAAMDEMLDAFAGTAAGPTNAADAASAVPLTEAVKALLKNPDPEIRFAAACAMLGRGDTSAIAEIAAGFSERPEDERRQLAYSVQAVAGRAESLPFFTGMLRDPSADVRSAAVAAMLQSKKADRIDAIFRDLLSPDTRLRPSQVYSYNLRSDMGPGTARRLREWVLKMLAEDAPQWRQTLGLALLKQCWQRGDDARVEPFLVSKDPLVRRAAWYTLGRMEPKVFRERAAVPAGDSSDLVRMVVPAMFRTSGGRWVQYFTQEEFEEDWDWDHSESGKRLDDNLLSVLRKLGGDQSPRVRFEAMLSLVDRGEDVQMERLAKTVEELGDVDRAAYQLQSVLERGGRRIAPEDAQALLAVLERGESRERSLSWLRSRAKVGDSGSDEESLAFTARRTAPVPSVGAGAEPAAAVARSNTVHMVYFVKAGCPECGDVNRHLDALRREFPALKVEEHDIEKSAGKRYNEALCKRFGVPDVRRLVAPAIFVAAGAAVKEDATYARLGELINRSASMTDAGWAEVPEPELAEADTQIRERWDAMPLTVVVGSGLADGVNPCAFATIIFLLSYLQVVRRTPRQILAIGMAFVAGVFVAYYGLGLGLAEAVRHSEIVQRAGRTLNMAMAVAVAILAVLNVRDGIICAQGRMGEMLLQLPGGLKAAIHRVIRLQVRQAWMALAAFGAGAVVSVLEMACTGQVYLPTIYYILRQDPAAVGPNVYLLVYNVAFIVPLVVVFALAYSGVRSERVAAWLQRHAAAVKFATAALFVAMLVLLVKQA
jgi:HEAT repeat protein